jgi:hypothetical protein
MVLGFIQSTEYCFIFLCFHWLSVTVVPVTISYLAVLQYNHIIPLFLQVITNTFINMLTGICFLIIQSYTL